MHRYFLILAWILAASLAGAADVAAPKIVGQPAPEFCGPLRVELEAKRTEYRDGEPMQLAVRVAEDAYIFLYSTDSDGITRQLFPNAYDQNNFVRGGETRILPRGSYEFVATGRGWDTIYCYAVGVRGSGSDLWKPPATFYTFPKNKPFPEVSGGGRAAKDVLSKDLRARWMQVQSAPQTQGRPQLPGNATTNPFNPLWGEAYVQIYVSPTWLPPIGYRPIYRPPNADARDWGKLTVRSSPNRADVYVNNALYGQTPLTMDLEKGNHEVIIYYPGFAPYRKQVKLGGNEKESMTVKLQRPTSNR